MCVVLAITCNCQKAAVVSNLKQSSVVALKRSLTLYALLPVAMWLYMTSDIVVIRARQFSSHLLTTRLRELLCIELEHQYCSCDYGK